MNLRSASERLVAAVWGVALAALLAAPAALWASILFAAVGDGADSEWAALSTRALGAAARQTVLLAAVALPCALLLAGTGALLLACADLPGRRYWAAGLLLLACTPQHVVATAWIGRCSLAWLTSTPVHQILGAGAILGFAAAPLCTLWIAAALLTVPREPVEGALLHLAPSRVLLGVSLPLAGWSFAAAGLFVAFLAATDITVADALWLKTYPEEIFLAIRLQPDPGRAGLASLPLLAAAAVLALGAGHGLRRLTARPLARLAVDAPRLRLGPWRWTGAAVLAVLFVLYLHPFADLAWQATAVRGGGWLAEVLRRGGLVPASVGLAALGSGAAVVFALPIALRLHRGRARLLWACVLLLLVLPGPLAGLSLAAIWNRPGWRGDFYDSPGIVALLYAIRALPLCVVLLWAALRQQPRALFDQAALCGLRGSALLFGLVVPLCRRALFCAWLLGYLFSLAEVGGTLIAVPPGLPLFSVAFATQIHYGVYPDLARTAFLPLLLSLAPAWFALRLFRQDFRGRRGPEAA